MCANIAKSLKAYVLCYTTVLYKSELSIELIFSPLKLFITQKRPTNVPSSVTI